MEAEKKITLVLLLLGRYERQVRQLDEKIKELKHIRNDAEIVIAADDPQWLTAPQLQMFGIMEKSVRIVCCNEAHSVPAKAMNLALKEVKTEYVQFCLLDDPLTKRFESFNEALKPRKRAEKKSGLGSPMAYYICPCVSGTSEFLPGTENAYGWSQCSQVGIGIGAFCVSSAALKAIGEIDENPLLRVQIERWYALALYKNAELIDVDTETERFPSLSEYPMDEKLRVPQDIAIRYATYCHGVAAPKRSPQQCAEDFAKDINENEAELYYALTGIKSTEPTPYNKKYRILIVGGHWEYHHNQICFFNYLERLYGKGYATYRAMFEYDIPANLALDYDFVIFTRCRGEDSLRMMRLCEQNNIPTLYMIDDNWLSIAEDHPEQGGIFVAGNANYDNFLEALGLCKATWLFNDLLKEDVLPYTKCVQKFRISVDPLVFQSEDARKRSDDKLYVGFAGSLRYDDTAFRALARYARRHSNVKVVLMGYMSDSQELLFKNIDSIRIGFESYARYAHNIGAIRPDMLLAPLTDTHTAHSKCYNKYIESGIAGAVCMCSDCLPYSDVIHDGDNGYIVKDDTAEGWYRKLEEVLSDIPKLREVQRRMERDIMENHTVDVLLQPFAEKLSSIIEGDVEDD